MISSCVTGISAIAAFSLHQEPLHDFRVGVAHRFKA
jgi:hypothetical protein